MAHEPLHYKFIFCIQSVKDISLPIRNMFIIISIHFMSKDFMNFKTIIT